MFLYKLYAIFMLAIYVMSRRGCIFNFSLLLFKLRFVIETCRCADELQSVYGSHLVTLKRFIAIKSCFSKLILFTFCLNS